MTYNPNVGDMLKSTYDTDADDVVDGILRNLYGRGVDGAITDSANITRSGKLEVTDYTLQSGVTLSIGASGVLFILAQGKITINGTIDGTAVQAGGSGAVCGGSPTQGSGGVWGGVGAGGGVTDGAAGGNGGTNAGGGGGDGSAGCASSAGADAPAISGNNKLRYWYPNSDWETLILENAKPCTSGSGGGAGEGDSFYGTSGGSGGDGGSAGGVVVLIAPSIEINGTIDVSGSNGMDGETPTQPNGDDSLGGGGGGGGGSGGVIFISSGSFIDNGTYLYGGGIGGAGGTGVGTMGYDGGAGGNGLTGVLKKN